MKNKLSFFTIVVFIFVSLSELSALEVVPFVHSFDPVQDGNSFQFYITNKTNDIIAFEVSAFSRKHNERGEEALEKDDESFVIFPSQIIIPPQTQRTVKVKWIGNRLYEKNKNIEQAFRVLFDQFPVNLHTKKLLAAVNGPSTSVDIRFRVLTSLYITPKGASGHLEVVKDTGTNIVIKNTGTKRISISEDTQNITVNGKKLKDIVDKNQLETVILAGETRIFKKVSI